MMVYGGLTYNRYTRLTTNPHSFIYNPISNTWTANYASAATAYSHRAMTQAVAFSSTVVAGGGLLIAGDSRVQIFDPVQNRRLAMTAASQGAGMKAVTIDDGRVYASTPRQNQLWTTTGISGALVYNPVFAPINLQ